MKEIKLTSLSKRLKLTQSDLRKLPLVVTSKNLYVIDAQSKRKRRLFVQRSDAFSTDLFSLLEDLKSGSIVEISFRNELLGEFRLTRLKGGKTNCSFFPVNEGALAELNSRLAKLDLASGESEL